MKGLTFVACLAVFVTGSVDGETLPVKLDEEDRVMVQVNGKWGFVHPPEWDDKDADVVCRSLGFKEGLASKGSFSWPDKMLIYKIRCLGSETHLSQCNYTTEKPSDVFTFTYSAVARCLNERFTLSLVGGPNAQSGWVMATKGDYSGRLCNTYPYWNEENMNVICRSLGFESGVLFPLSDMPTGNVSAAEIKCIGQETDLNACIMSDWKFQNSCPSDKVQRVYCYKKVRLSPLTASSLGNVFVRDRTICADGFGAAAAAVTCKELGYSGGEALEYSPFKYNFNSKSYRYVNCTGDEDSLLACDFPEVEEKDFPCGSTLNIATVKCFVENEVCVDRPDCDRYFKPQACDIGYNEELAKHECRNFCNYCPESDWQVRVVAGKIFVSQYGYFGEVYVGGFDDSAAVIMCKNQGKDTGVITKLSTKFQKESMVWRVKLTCPETAQDLSSCTFTQRSDNPEYSASSAGVFCYDYDEETTLSLEGGTRPNYGYLVVHQNGTSGVVCSNIWTTENTHIACTEMGYVAGKTFYGSHESSPRDMVFASEIECSYSDRKFDMCLNEKWKKFRTEDINWDKHEYPCFGTSLDGVFCHNGILLHTGGYKEFGIVETSHHSNYQFRMCAIGFDDKAATVVCRMLWFSSKGIVIPKDLFPYYSWSAGQIMNVSCTGNEASLFDCMEASPMEYGDCTDGSVHPAVACSDSTDGSIKVEGMDEHGRVVVSRYGINGTICESSWMDHHARLFCLQMGFDGGKAKSVFPYSAIIRPRWVISVSCSGNDVSLSDCDFTSTIPDTCPHSNDAGVECFNNDDQ